MKKLSIAPISDSAKMPIKKGTLQFLQDAHIETSASIIKSMIGSTYNASLVYIFDGLINSGIGTTYNFTAGAVFYNGEIYQVDAVSFTTAVGEVPVISEIITQYTTYADPVTFSDSTTHNVHDIRKMQIISGVSGSGTSDFANAVYLSLVKSSDVLTKTNITPYDPTTDYHPATKKYVDDNRSSLLWLGTVSADGTTVNKQSGSLTGITVSRTGTGIYVLTHNIGSLNYYVLGIGLYNAAAPFSGLRSYNPANNSFTYYCSDDNSGNDIPVQIAIYRY